MVVSLIYALLTFHVSGLQEDTLVRVRAHSLILVYCVNGQQNLSSIYTGMPGLKIIENDAARMAVMEAEMKLTPLLLRIGIPLIGVTSSLLLDVSFCVFLLKPVNCIVAPSMESISDPINPAIKPANPQ